MKTNYWEGVFGQTSVKQILQKFLHSSNIPHALLFNGQDGLGKDFVAIRFIQALNQISNSKNISPLESKHTTELAEPYIKFITPLPRGKNETDDSGPLEKLSAEDIDNLKNELQIKHNNPYHKIKLPRANSIKINSIRDLRKFISYDYSDIPYRLILISGAHMMNEDSQNALLKSLEEPPPGIIFILTTSNSAQLRETIRSRCWTVNFRPLTESEVKNVLIKYFGIKKVLAEETAAFANGSVTSALNLIEHEFEYLKESTIKILRYSFGKKYFSAFSEINNLIDDNSNATLVLIIHMIITWLSDLNRYKSSESKVYFSSHSDTIVKFLNRFPNTDFANLVTFLNELSVSITRHINPNVAAFNIITALSSLIQKKQILT